MGYRNLSYEVLAHETFMDQVLQFQQNCGAYYDDLVHELKVIQSNPFATGSRTMHDIGDRELMQKILRRHVGGRGGHRLIFAVERQKQIALPAFVSMVPKARFDYATARWGKFTWLELCRSIIEDSADESKFRRLRFP